MKHFKYLALCVVAASTQSAWAQPLQPPATVLPVAPPGQTPEQQRQQMEAEQLKSEAEQRHTPQGTLQQFAMAINDNNLTLAARCVEGGRASADLKRLQSRQEKAPSSSRLEVTPLFEQPAEGEAEFMARVAVSLRAQGLMSDDALLQSKSTFIERVSMQLRKNGEWKIVARPAPPRPQAPEDGSTQAQAQAIEAAARAAQSEEDGFLNTWARAMVQPHALLMHSVALSSMSNVKQILLGIIQLTQDYDEKFAFTTANFHDKVFPYIKSEQVFQAPAVDEDKPLAYTVNPTLAGKSLADLDEPAQTVAVYEAGPDGKPLFRFGGKAVIGFADGHVRLIGPEQAQNMTWQLKPKSIKAS